MDEPVDLLYTFDLGGRKGSDGDMSPTSTAADSNIIRPDGQWGVYRLQSGGLFAYVEGPISTAGIASGYGGDGYGGWKSVNITLGVPSSLWDVQAGASVPLPADAMGYIGVTFAPGYDLAPSLVSVVSRRDFSSGRWSFGINFSSGTGEFGPGLNNEIFESARFHLAVTGVGSSTPPAPPFWTGFVNAHEITGDGATPGGSDHPTATTVTVPFTTTLGAVAFNEALWFQATLSAGSWTFDTADSPLPEDHDTCLALYNSSGVLVATNDDIDVVGGDYRSSITQTLAAGTYYLAVGGYDATVGNGFTFTGAASLIAGAVLNIAAT